MNRINASIITLLAILFIVGMMFTSQASTKKWRLYDSGVEKCVPVNYDCVPKDVVAN